MPQGIVLIVFFLLLMLLEWRFPLRQQTAPALPRLLSNISLSLILLLTVFLITRPLNLQLFHWHASTHFGLTALLPNQPWLQSIVAFLCLDLSYYYWHRLSHEWSFLWRFHVVHHIDFDLDVTTSLRFHFMEVIFTVAFRFLQIILIGVSLPLYLLYEFYFQLATYFHHSNLGLPKCVDRSLAFLIVTPRLHGIHHSTYLDEMNRNYGVIFTFWDRLHGTIRQDIPQNELDIGVAAYQAPDSNQVSQLLIQPFRQQKNAFRAHNRTFYTRKD